MSKKQLFLLVGMLIVLLIVFSGFASGLAAYNSGEELILDPYVSTVVHRQDGTIDYSDSNYFPVPGKGDRLVMTIPLPEEKKISSAVLFCSVYQCAVELSYNGKILYSYGDREAEEGKAIGNVLVLADIPEEAWGKELTLDCQVAEYTDFAKLDKVVVCEAKNFTRHLLGDQASTYLLSIAVLIVFAVMFFVLLFWKGTNEIKLQGMYLSVFCVSMMLWLMGYQRMFYVLSNNVGFCGITEYVGIFFAPPAFCMFMYYIETNKLFQKVMRIYAAVTSIFFVVSTLLNFATSSLHYARLLKIDHVFIGVIALTTLVEFVLVRCRGDNKQLLIRFGVILYLLFVASDLVVFYLEKIEAFQIKKGSQSISSLGLYVFLIVMMIAYVMHVLEHVVTVKEKERLENMAYLDGMTGMANRRKCLDYLSKINRKKDYTIFFFDVNDLKAANDDYGHDVGDMLIMSVAQIVKNVFAKGGFCGRYGGDEFVAAVEYSAPERIKDLEKRLAEEIEKTNKEKRLPFPVAVAYGVASKAEGEEGNADAVVRLADERMYECKKNMKEAKI